MHIRGLSNYLLEDYLIRCVKKSYLNKLFEVFKIFGRITT
jgi:hypothetical protein